MTDRTPTIFRFEDFSLDLQKSELRKAGVPVPLEPQVLDLLALLLKNHERVLTKDEIVDGVWHGRIVSDSAISTRINALRRALGDDGSEQRLIRTVHGRGFRFGTVPETLSADGGAQLEGAEALATKPGIAVLPFVPMSDDGDLAFFADGIAEDIIDALSRFHEFSVIARSSSFRFRNSEMQMAEIAGALGVKYLLEGSVRQVGQRIRVAVQLIDASADRTIWSERYDGDLSDIFSVQDEITAKAVTAIAPQAHHAEMSSVSRKDIARLSDWERVMRARWHAERYSREDTDTALSILVDVIQSAPDLALAHSTMAFCHFHKMLNAWGDDPVADIQAAEAAAREAVSHDPYDASALALMGISALFGWRYEECFDLLKQALSINPNLASGYGFLCTVHGCLGQLPPALDAYDRAMRLSPADPTRVLWMSGKGIGLYLDHQYEATIENADRMLRLDPTYGPALRQLASSHARLGQMTEARAAMRRILDAMPTLTITRLAKMVPVSGPENQKHWLDGLRAAGLPE